MAGDQSLAALVGAASAGDAQAWDELVERYASLVVAVCRRFRLTDADLHDVSQTVWLRLVEHLPDLREPRALPGWLVTTAKRECLRVIGLSRGQVLVDEPPEPRGAGDDADADLLAAERRSALREAFADLPRAWRELMALLLVDPPLPYAEISRRLGMPIGSIGPTRARCIERLRAAAPLAALLEQEPDGVRSERPTAEAGTRRR